MDNNGYENCKELIKLQENLKSAEQSKASGNPNISLDEVKAKIQNKYNTANGIKDYSMSQ